MGLAGAGYGAAKTLEDILAERFEKQKLQEAIAAREAALAEQQRASMADEENRRQQIDINRRQMDFQTDQADRTRRERGNQQGVRTMAADFIRQREGALTPDDKRQLAAMQLEVGDSPDLKSLEEPPKREFPVESVDEQGRPIQRLVGEEELRGGVRRYEKPPTPEKPERPQYIQVQTPDGKLQVMTPDEIRRTGGVDVRQPTGTTLGSANQALRATRTASALNAIETLKALNPPRAEGPLGVVQGLAKTGKAMVGMDSQTNQFRKLLGPTAMMAAVAIQGAANLSDQEREVWKQALGNLHTMDYETQVALLDHAAEMLRSGADVELRDVRDAGTGQTVKRWVPTGRGAPSSVDLKLKPTEPPPAAPQAPGTILLPPRRKP